MVRTSVLSLLTFAGVLLSGPVLAAIPPSHYSFKCDSDLFGSHHSEYFTSFTKVKSVDKLPDEDSFMPVTSHCTYIPPRSCDHDNPTPAPESTSLVGLTGMVILGALLATARRSSKAAY